MFLCLRLDVRGEGEGERGNLPAMAGEAPWLATFWVPTVKELDVTCQKPEAEFTGTVVSLFAYWGSTAPKVYVPVESFRRSTEKSGWANCGMIVSKKVFCLVGLTVLSCEKARPSRPSLLTSLTKDWEIAVASSTACWVAVAPPMLTVSKPTVPAAPDPSP